jgi:hypothetical protein
MQLTPFKAHCPYCGERINVLIDTYSGPQQYIEDCEVCCRPMVCQVSVDVDGDYVLSLDDENAVI